MTCQTCGSTYTDTCFTCELSARWKQQPSVRPANVGASAPPSEKKTWAEIQLEKHRAAQEIEDALAESLATGPKVVEDCFHTCTKCGETHSHDIPETECKVSKRYTCDDCITASQQPKALEQDVAEINRRQAIEEIARSARLLTNQEIGETMLAHEQFVVLNLIHDTDGSIRANKDELLEKHWLDIRKTIEQYRIKEIATKRVMAKLKIDEIGKLTPEEREAYKRQAAKPPRTPKKAATAEEEKKKNLSKEMKMAEKMLKSFGAKAIPMVCETFGITEEQAKSLLN